MYSSRKCPHTFGRTIARPWPVPSFQVSVVLLVALFAACHEGSAQCSRLITADFVGGVRTDGRPESQGTFTFGRQGEVVSRGYALFRLPAFSAPLRAASLSMEVYPIDSPNGTALVEVWNPPATVLEMLINGEKTEALYAGLGTGVLCASQLISTAHPGAGFIPLNETALEQLWNGTHLGNEFLLGFASVGTDAGTNNRVTAYNLRLTLEFATDGPPVIIDALPEVVVAMSNAGPVTITVPACGGWTKAQWFRDSTLLSSETNLSITVPPVPALAGFYWIVLTNNISSVTSTVSHVYVQESPPLFDPAPILPSVVEIIAGGPLLLGQQVRAFPRASLQWYRDDQPLPGQNLVELDLPKVEPSDAGRYWLEASNALGTATGESWRVIVHPLAFNPQSVVAFAGETVYLNSGAWGYAPLTSVTWTHEGTNVPGASGPVLTLTNVSAADAGAWRAIASNAYGSRTSDVIPLQVRMSGPNLYRLDVPDTSLALGADLVISGGFEGSGPITVTWRHDGSILPGETNETLIVHNVTLEDSGSYEMAVSNVMGQVGRSLMITVDPAKPFVLNLNSAGIGSGDSFVLAPGFYGAPKPDWGLGSTFQWSVGGKPLLGETNWYLFRQRASRGDEGNYTLHVSNASTSVVAETSVVVAPRRALDRWTWRRPRTQVNDLQSIAAGNGRYVALADLGFVLWSSNSVDWALAPVQLEANRVRFNGSEFVAPLQANNHLAFVSTNGSDWSVRELAYGEADALDAVTGNGARVSNWQYSLDQEHWRALPFGYLGKVAFGNGRFVGFTPTWSPQQSVIWLSVDGVTWTAQPAPQAGLDAIAFGKGLFVLAGENGDLFTSPDGALWTARPALGSRDVNDVIFDGAQFLACGNRGFVATSPNGLSWTVRTGNEEELFGIVYAHGQFVAVGDEGTALTSTDLATWTSRTTGSSRDLHGITYAQNQYVAVGRKGTILTSPDATQWTARSSKTSSYLERVTYGGGLYVAVGGNPPVIVTSPDGVNWSPSDLSPLDLDPTTELQGVAYGNSMFLAVGGFFRFPVSERTAQPVVLGSTDGRVWQSMPVPRLPVVGNDGLVILRNIIFGNDRFLAVGNDGLLSWSTNGTDWSTTVQYARNQRSALFVPEADRFISAGNSGSVFSTRAQREWNFHVMPLTLNVHDLAYGLGRIVVVGNGGLVMDSDLLLPQLEASRTGNGLALDIRGGLEPEYDIEASQDLGSWSTIGIYTNFDGTATITEESTQPQRFYRAQSPAAKVSPVR